MCGVLIRVIGILHLCTRDFVLLLLDHVTRNCNNTLQIRFFFFFFTIIRTSVRDLGAIGQYRALNV